MDYLLEFEIPLSELMNKADARIKQLDMEDSEEHDLACQLTQLNKSLVIAYHQIDDLKKQENRLNAVAI